MSSIIILIGPMSAGKSTIAQLLAERLGVPRYELDKVKHPSNHRLAKKAVCTKGHTPEETCDEILERIERSREGTRR